MTRAIAGAALVLLLGLTGCANGVEGPRMQSRLIPGANPDDVLQRAEIILRREFRGVSAASARRLETAPRERTGAGDTGSARDFVGGSATLRERGMFSVSSRGDGAMASLRVIVEREDTDRRSASSLRADENRLSDSPSYSAIERDAATSTRQNKVWTYVKRNLALERAVLSELAEYFAGGSAVREASDAEMDSHRREERRPMEESESQAYELQVDVQDDDFDEMP